ncbi:MAG: hypothetical protein WDM89_07650 [Rhizomicrobium sp.]
MPRKRQLEGTICVDGAEYRWSVSREPQWCTADGYKGLSLSVRLASSSGRELLLEYPFAKGANGMAKLPQRPKVNPKSVETGIRDATAAGWEPTSRGKAFAFQVALEENSN